MADVDRLFNPHGRRHFRRSYNLAEVRIGGLIVLGLVLIAAWVVYKGAHPDPELMGNDLRLIPKGDSSIPLVAENRLPPRQSSAADLGPLASTHPQFAQLGPEPWTPSDWEVGRASTFGPDNLFEKINGREGFYKSFGFRQLNFVTLSLRNSPETTIDIEWFDLGQTSNALGAFAAERPEEATVQTDSSGLRYTHRNMSAMVRGPNYIRLVGSDESEVLRAALAKVANAFVYKIAGDPLPWSFGFFVTVLRVPVQNITVEKDHAFSFEFARNVHIARISEDLELFVTAYPSPEEAQIQAATYHKGFLSLGTSTPDGLINNRYLGTFAAARSTNNLVFGLRGAASPQEAERYLSKLRGALNNLSDENKAHALAETQNTEERSSETNHESPNLPQDQSTRHPEKPDSRGPEASGEEDTYE